MKLTIKAAKELAQQVGARQVVVCAFDGGSSFGVVSYGATKKECQDVRRLCDAIADDLAVGRLPAPEART